MSRAARHGKRSRPAVLVMEADEALRETLVDELASSHEVLVPPDEDAALEALATREVALLVMAARGGSSEPAFERRERLVAAGHDVPMMIVADVGDEDLAVEAVRRGFMDYMVRREPNLRGDLIRQRVANAIELARLKRENEELHRAIEESQARLFNVYDSLDDAIMQVDEDCRVVSLNRSAAALANREPREAVGRVCWELFDFHPCERRAKKDECHIYRTFLEGETIRGEREDAESGSVLQYMTFITTLGERDYVVYRETDITEKRRLEQRIANALKSLGMAPDDESSGPGGE